MPDKNTDLSPKEAKDIFNGLISLEEKRLEIEKLREKNRTKELESSEKTAITASELAKKDIELSDEKDKRNITFKKIIVNRVFIFGIATIVTIVGLTIFLCLLDKTVLYPKESGFPQ